jgi:hypothetical protein
VRERRRERQRDELMALRESRERRKSQKTGCTRQNVSGRGKRREEQKGTRNIMLKRQIN